ncbi:hypothetical protein [Nocardia sp. BMG51109]|uniref:hypothetical protein n=1 Tax=Nocardia sp. BMG51109 TaxID=1056816 RepID=UPI0004636BFE|nr:hypothetical protein [Nocardia sp. BMG51109]
MTATLPHNVRTLTADDVRSELARLTAAVEARGYTLDQFKEAGERWELDADERGLLSDVCGLEFFLDRIGR